ncbi:MAG TPA: pyrroline-5-carboxylate reductase [Burkholderiaceae bacterium]|nr:pyrroline-5-carboxylate reductase [Burkholderiaceae bacterium]
MSASIVFIGGGNMAAAIVGGLVKSAPAPSPSQIAVVELDDARRQHLNTQYGVHTLPAADGTLATASLIVWAVKPQSFREAALPVAPFGFQALHLSVMAGIRSDAIASAMGTDRVVRAMPNTPALIGQGISGLFARPGVVDSDRERVEQVLRPVGECIWVDHERDLDAVTALSGSGPAYVFYFIEAMMQAAAEMGLDAEKGKQLAIATFAGASALARLSADPPSVLRERVTSKGGTTQAALTRLEQAGVKAAFVEALKAAQKRAHQLGDEFSS